jgi:anti-sigma-K factor RskA
MTITTKIRTHLAVLACVASAAGGLAVVDSHAHSTTPSVPSIQTRSSWSPPVASVHPYGKRQFRLVHSALKHVRVL